MLRDPVRRLRQGLIRVAVWGGLAVLVTCLQNLPLFGGRVWLLPLLPLIAGRRYGWRGGWLVGVTAGLLHSWTVDGWFGVTGILLGLWGVVVGGGRQGR